MSNAKHTPGPKYWVCGDGAGRGMFKVEERFVKEPDAFEAMSENRKQYGGEWFVLAVDDCTVATPTEPKRCPLRCVVGGIEAHRRMRDCPNRRDETVNAKLSEALEAQTAAMLNLNISDAEYEAEDIDSVLDNARAAIAKARKE